MTDPELSLRRLFGALRRADERAVPPFRDVIAEARRRHPGRATRVAVRAAAFAVAAAALVLLVLRLGAPDEGLPLADLRAATWEGPTDFLLDIPGAELLRAVPELGTMPNLRLN